MSETDDVLHGRRWRTLVAAALRGTPMNDRVFFHNIWFQGHNNPRYLVLLPRLARLDPYLALCSRHRLVRGAQFRLLHGLRKPRNRIVFALANRSYRFMFSTATGQAERFRGTVVVDVDDPRFDAAEVASLNRPNVAAFVVTTQRAGERFRQLGVRTPFHVIPQGVRFGDIDPARVAVLGARLRRSGEVTVGYVAAYLRSAADRDGANPLYNVDHLLELWPRIAERAPDARLWLIGDPSDRVRERCAAAGSITLFGRLPQPEALAHLANVDVAVYPRRVDHAPFAVKLAEYLGLGLPTVSYDLPIADVITEAHAGICARDPDEFVDAVVGLIGDPQRRAELARNARVAGRQYDWRDLVERYEREIFDVYFPPRAR